MAKSLTITMPSNEAEYYFILPSSLSHIYRYIKFLSADSAPKAPGIRLMTQNLTNLYYFSLTPAPNRSRVDIDFYKATAVGDGLNETFMLHNDTSEFMLPFLYQYDAHNFTLEVIAVDRCGQQSPAAMVVIPGK